MDFISFGLAANQLSDDVSENIEFGDFHVEKNDVHFKRILKKYSTQKIQFLKI